MTENIPQNITIDFLMENAEFRPNPQQDKAIKHIDGPLFLTAGPGSGKTRVLLWRTLNLIVFHGINPIDIVLTTFTEKAALQLKDGLRSYLGQATNFTKEPYDISQMYVGTVHSLCQKLLNDRRFTLSRSRNQPFSLMDDLEQYFYVKNTRRWNAIMEAGGLELIDINRYFTGPKTQYENKYRGITSCISLFNRFSEENIDITNALANTTDPMLQGLLKMYREYRRVLKEGDIIERTDFSIIQQKALEHLVKNPASGKVFQHVIVDEYQDTNPIQERLFFLLAGNANICVVGDDDQALYRFRGATVENFVEFPERCQQLLGIQPTKIPLNINYRSRKGIVDFYTDFIEKEDWENKNKPGTYYRVHDKEIEAFNQDENVAVLTTEKDSKGETYPQEVALFVKRLLEEKKVEDLNQIAFLYFSVKGKATSAMIGALEAEGIRTYAPRAGRFLEVPESIEIFGILIHILGKPDKGKFSGRDFDAFHDWMDLCYETAEIIIQKDSMLKSYIEERRGELTKILNDYRRLIKTVEKEGWDLMTEFDVDTMRRPLGDTTGISKSVHDALYNKYFLSIIKARQEDPKEDNLKIYQIINRLTAVDWSVLDIFYQISGFEHFKKYYDWAESGEDEAPIINLGLISKYLAKFTDIYFSTLYASITKDEGFQRLFFSNYLYTIFRRNESEYEDEDNPFPKGRIPFLTIHQSKGLEFPVVFLNPLRKQRTDPMEAAIREVTQKTGEPLDRIANFDKMRMFYVGLSRAENLLIIPDTTKSKEFKKALGKNFPKIEDFDIKTLPQGKAIKENDLSKPYSYTSDFMLYTRCPRQYMVFRRYGFVASRSQTMFFGSVVHRTIEDLHQHLISLRNEE